MTTKTAFEALLDGVQAGVTAWETDNAPEIIKVPAEYHQLPPEFGEIFQAGTNLAEEHHWISVSETDEEAAEGKAQYDSFAYWANGFIGQNVAETFEGSLSGKVGFLNPETGEYVTFPQ